MKCPHCKKELKVASTAYANADMYDNAVLAKTQCCGKGVMIYPIRNYHIYAYTGDKTEDDWGAKLDKK